nr:MAG TPA: hypothetical protein [Caudoviricetes sp.]
MVEKKEFRNHYAQMSYLRWGYCLVRRERYTRWSSRKYISLRPMRYYIYQPRTI